MSQASAASESGVLGTIQALILFVGALVGASVGVGVWQGVAAPLGVAEGTTAAQLLRTVFQFAGFAAPVVLFVVAAGDRSLLPVSVPDRRNAALALGGFLVLFVLQYGLVAALGALGVAPTQNPAIDPETHEPVYFLWMVLVSIFVVGPAEELLFRGAIQGLLKRAWGRWPAIVAAAALFGSLHLFGGVSASAVAYVAIAFLLGAVLGVLYDTADNLVVPALAHGLFNAVAFGVQYLSVAG